MSTAIDLLMQMLHLCGSRQLQPRDEKHNYDDEWWPSELPVGHSNAAFTLELDPGDSDDEPAAGPDCSHEPAVVEPTDQDELLVELDALRERLARLETAGNS